MIIAVVEAEEQQVDGVRGWSRRRRLWVGAAAVVLASVVGYVGLVAVLALLDGGRFDWTGPLGGVVGAVVATVAATWWQQRRMGGGERAEQFERARRSRRLPGDADPAVWRPLLARERRALYRALIAWRVLSVGCAVGLVVLLLTDADPDRGAGTTATVAGLLVVSNGVAWWLVRRGQARIDRLAEQLPEPGPDPAPALH